eukprot:10397247-Ditylum_brightwellii.AAC.1
MAKVAIYCSLAKLARSRGVRLTNSSLGAAGKWSFFTLHSCQKKLLELRVKARQNNHFQRCK